MTINGRSEPASTPPIASIARLSISQILLELRKVVDKRGVNHRIRRGGSAAQAFQIFEITPMHLGAGSGQ